MSSHFANQSGAARVFWRPMQRFLPLLALLGTLGAAPQLATAALPADAPRISVADATIAEGNTGFRDLSFLASIPKPVAYEVTVKAQTIDMTAKAGTDYTASTGNRVIIRAGETSGLLKIRISTDKIEERDEQFRIRLYDATNATLLDGDALGTVLDDDYAGQISINDISFVEQNSGLKVAKSLVRFSQPALHDISVRYETKSGTAKMGSDFVDTKGTLLFKPGRVALDVLVPVRGDRLAEADENFAVNLIVTGYVPQKGSGAVKIVNDDGPMQAPDGKIAFISDRDARKEVYVMNGDGSYQTRLTTNTATENNPNLSADGSKICFETDLGSAYGNYYSRIGLMNSDGTGKTYLPAPTDAFGDYYPSFSPDGTKILFLTAGFEGRQIKLMNLDGSDEKAVTTTNVYFKPSFSPDGTQILFAQVQADTRKNDLFVVNVDGSGLKNLSNSPNIDEVAARFSFDGTQIAYEINSAVSGQTPPDLMLMNRDGSGQTALPNAANADFNPGFSPNGQGIGFESTRGGASQIYSMDAEGNRQTRLTSLGTNSAFSWSRGLVAAPVGLPPSSLSGKIAFVTQRQIWVINANGTSKTKLTTQNDDFPRFSRDGSKITFVSYRDGVPEIYVMDADGANQTRLTRSPSATSKRTPSFSPDGGKIIFSDSAPGASSSDLYVMNSDGTGLSKIVISGGTPRDPYVYAPAFSPDGQKIAFSTSTRGAYSYANEGKIWVMNADGTNPTVLRDQVSLPDASSCYYAPDGGRLVFESYDNSNNTIHVMNADGGGEKILTGPDDEGRSESPCFSPDGSAIVYVFLGIRDSQLFIMNGDGQGKTAVPNSLSNDLNLKPSWAPGSVAAPAASPAARPNPSGGNS